jgi:hypothetical protein
MGEHKKPLPRLPVGPARPGSVADLKNVVIPRICNMPWGFDRREGKLYSNLCNISNVEQSW